MPPACTPLCQFGDRLYFTTFPHPAPVPQTLNTATPTDEDGGAPPARKRCKSGPGAGSPEDDAKYYYFTIDGQLRYLSFFQDWGPLNMAMVYKACILIHELLEDKNLSAHKLVLYSSDDPRRKANAALLMALYVMIVHRRAPWEAFHPIAEMEFMPFRDAGRGRSDFNLNIQDCLWGVWKAMQNGLCDMNDFSVEDYEFYEKVENGDWNWITPNFIAFASPVDLAWIKKEKDKKEEQRVDGTPSPARSRASTPGANLALQRKLPTPFLNCLDYFEKKNIKLVVRLNNELYDKTVFLDRGINHVELYFDDGTNPTDEIVRKFIDMADAIIEDGGVVAVHCKAGLGRTGTLIGAYLIWKFGFTASEAIAFMRIVRPGSVVGPQQQYMYLKQLEWTKWAAVDDVRKSQMASTTQTATLVTPATPPAEADDVELMPVDLPPVLIIPSTPPPLPPVTPSKHVATAAARAKAISPPGQPRKTPQAKRVIADTEDDADEDDDELDVLPVLGKSVPSKVQVKHRPVRARGVTASEQRPIRTTRSTAAAAGVSRKAPLLASPSKGTGQAPNKIPRLANGTSTRGNGTTNRPSRLPTLIPSKRVHNNSVSSLSEVAAAATATLKAGAASDAWMTNNASAVVVPGSKSERPGLRPIRRRRSSFSAADVVA